MITDTETKVNPSLADLPFTNITLELVGEQSDTFDATMDEGAAEMAHRFEMPVTSDDARRLLTVAFQDMLEQVAQMTGDEFCDWLTEPCPMMSVKSAAEQELRIIRNRKSNPWKPGVLEAAGATWAGGRK